MARARKGSAIRWLAGLVGCLLLIGIQSGVASGETVRLGSFGPDGTETSNFQEATAVGVDLQGGAVYVLDGPAGTLYKFDAAGSPEDFGGSTGYVSGNRIEGLQPNTSRSSAEVAVDPNSHVIYVTEKEAVRAFQANGEPAEFTAGSAAGTNELTGFSQLFGVAIDSNGNIYASDHSGTISAYASTGEFLTSFAAAQPYNISVAPDGTVFVIEEAFHLRGHVPSSYPIGSGTSYSSGVEIEPLYISQFEAVSLDPSNGDLYVLETNLFRSWIRVFDKSGSFKRSFGEPETPGEQDALGESAQGLAVVGEGSLQEFYVGNSQGGEESFSRVDIYGTEPIVVGPPAIATVDATGVTADSATLRASINPNTAETNYFFEYGPADCASTVCTSVPIGGGSIPAGHEPVAVSQAITGLEAGRRYHYRVVATNQLGPPTVSADHSFTTQTATLGFGLGDSRAWEMVSPPNKHGGLLQGSLLGLIQAAADGNGLAYTGFSSIEVDPAGNRLLENSTFLAHRTSPGEWQSQDITPPNATVSALSVGLQTEFALFSPDLSQGMVERRGATPLSLAASERTPYLWQEGNPPLFTPLVTGKESFANVPFGTEFGGNLADPIGAVRLRAATQDMAHIGIVSRVPLREDVPDGSALYLWSAGQLRTVSIMPASEGGEAVAAEWIGSGPASVRNAISNDGTRVFWSGGSSLISSFNGLFVRDIQQGETFRLDVPQEGASGLGTVNPVFQDASPDGTTVYFTDSQQLTADASSKGRDLYQCEMAAGKQDGCEELIDISAPPSGGSESARVLGTVPGMSDDGSKLYFVAKGVLDAGSTSASENAVPGQPNLYFWQSGGAGPRFIANLSANDESDWGGVLGEARRLTAESSPSGRYLAFMSSRSLTGYDSRDPETDQPLQEAFRYDSAADELICVSCDPSGGLPRGQAAPGQLVDPREILKGGRLAAALPEPTMMEVAGVSLYQPRFMLDNGRVLFNAFDSLVPADSNGQWDAYQYEPSGSGGCNGSDFSAALVASGDGCVGLISSGTGESEAGFLDGSSSGDDAFFLTPAQLSPYDEDEEMDVYDARVGGLAATRPPSSDCSGDGCQAASPPPRAEVPGSATFNGSGNVKPGKKCPKGKKKVRLKGKTRCVPRHHKEQHGKRQGGRRGR